MSVSALVAAATIRQRELSQADRAQSLLMQAAASPVPHTDLDGAIQEGLRHCAALIPRAGNYSS